LDSALDFTQLPAGSEPLVAQALLTASGTDGTGNYIHGDVRDLKTGFAFSSVFELPDYTPFPGPGTMHVPHGFGGINNFSSVFLMDWNRVIVKPRSCLKAVTLARSRK
jgi:hypothetical protein